MEQTCRQCCQQGQWNLGLSLEKSANKLSITEDNGLHVSRKAGTGIRLDCLGSLHKWCRDPYTKSCIGKMEMVQRRAARYVLHRYHNTSSVGKMLDTPQWTSLEERRKQQRLAMLYKIQHGQVALDISDYLKPALRISRHSHELAFQVPSTSVDYIKFSFW